MKHNNSLNAIKGAATAAALLMLSACGAKLDQLVDDASASAKKSSSADGDSASADNAYATLLEKLDDSKTQVQSICPIDDSKDLEEQRSTVEDCIQSNLEKVKAIFDTGKIYVDACLPKPDPKKHGGNRRHGDRRGPGGNGQRPPQFAREQNGERRGPPPPLPEKISDFPEEVQSEVKAKLLSEECQTKLGT